MNSHLAQRILVGILLVIAAGIVVHAPLTVWLGTIWPHQLLVIKAWKELLMGVAFLLLFALAIKRDMVATFLSDRVMQLSLVYAGLHLAMMGLFQNGLQTAGAGLLIDLRYILYFVLVYLTIRLLPQYRDLFIRVFVAGAAIVIGFGVLQMTVLPKDILAHIGYSKATISPFLTVDENPAYIRINSTLRGPNPLGAYAAIVITAVVAIMIKLRLTKKQWWLAIAATVAAGLVLWGSYSRSSVIGLIVALLTIVVVSATHSLRKKLLVALAAVVVCLAAATLLLRHNSVVANLIWHDNPSTGASIDSNAGHLDSLVNGSLQVLRQPFGAGIGSAGSASLLGDKPMIIENQYLLIAHEVGWIGLALFIWLFVEIMRRLWQRRASAVALTVFGSGAGLAVIGLLLPVWTDDTVSIVWWGLAAVAIATERKVKKHASRKSN